MSLHYVTQVIYIPKINIKRPSPEDETAILTRVILYTHILFKMQSNFSLVLPTTQKNWPATIVLWINHNTREV